MSIKYLESIVNLAGNKHKWTPEQQRNVMVSGKLLDANVDHILSDDAETALANTVNPTVCVRVLNVLRQNYIAVTFDSHIATGNDLTPLLGFDVSPRNFVIVLTPYNNNGAVGFASYPIKWWISPKVLYWTKIDTILRELNMQSVSWMPTTNHKLLIIPAVSHLIEPVLEWVKDRQTDLNQYKFVLAQSSVWENA